MIIQATGIAVSATEKIKNDLEAEMLQALQQAQVEGKSTAQIKEILEKVRNKFVASE
jgi:hypothetical protein